MFCIRKEQVRVFETVRFPLFEQKMIAHISNYFEGLATILGKKGLSELIQHGYECSKKYGLLTAYEVCLYIDLMIMLGHAFDTDPQIPWTNEILINREIPNPTQRIELLYKRALGFIEMTMGRDQFLAIDQFKKMIGFSFEDLTGKISVSENLSKLLFNFWPAKFEIINAYSFKELIQEGRFLAAKYGFTTEINISYYLVLMFLLGHRFDNDLQYPWLTGILNNTELQDEYYKADSLQFMVKNYLSTILDSYHPNNEN